MHDLRHPLPFPSLLKILIIFQARRFDVGPSSSARLDDRWLFRELILDDVRDRRRRP